MKLKWIAVFSIVAVFTMLLPATLLADVHDNANIFSASAVDDANTAMKKMERVHNKQFVVETFASIPDDRKDAASQNPDTFFKDWMAARAKELKVNGVYALICMDPHHLEIGAGHNTIAAGDFTEQDVRGVYALMQAAMHNKDYDKALGDAVDKVERAYTANISSPNGRSAVRGEESGYSNGGAPNSMPTNSTGVSSTGVSFGSLICLAVGAVIIFSLIKSVLRGGTGGGGYGGGNYPPGGQGYGGSYGGGGGFGFRRRWQWIRSRIPRWVARRRARWIRSRPIRSSQRSQQRRIFPRRRIQRRGRRRQL